MATAVVSLPPRPSVVMSPEAAMPWKPVTTGITPCSSMRCRPSASTPSRRARPCPPSVRMAHWKAFRLRARRPWSSRAIAVSAALTASPVLMRASSSRRAGSRATFPARPINSSVVCPMALTTTATRCPSAFASATRRAARRMRSGSATEVPPNFITSVGIRPPGRVPRRDCARNAPRACGRFPSAASCACERRSA